MKEDEKWRAGRWRKEKEKEKGMIVKKLEGKQKERDEKGEPKERRNKKKGQREPRTQEKKRKEGSEDTRSLLISSLRRSRDPSIFVALSAPS